MKTLYIECKMGAAGDMLSAALYELLENDKKQEFLRQMNAMFADDIHFMPETKTACGITGTQMHVHVLGQEESTGDTAHHHHTGHTHSHEHDHTHSHEHTHNHTHSHEHAHDHHSYSAIQNQIESLPISEKGKRDAAAVYRLIGEAEAKVHQTDLEHIHFHEVGSLDALADVTAVCLLVSMLNPTQIIVSPIHVGNGSVHCAHGVLPVPAPATAELLKGIPWYTGEIASELCTPTGAALLKHFADRFDSMPVMQVSDIGIGHGAKEFAFLNAVRAFLGETDCRQTQSFSPDAHADQIADISCNLDDMTGEALGLCMELLLGAGALDVFYIPIQMKKNRPGILLHCLCAPNDLDTFCDLLFRHTTTRGVRYQYFDRKKLSTRFETVNTPFGNVRRKISENDQIVKAKYEFEDLRQIAERCGLSLYELLEKLSDGSALIP